jgi:hypothetical protein
MRCPTHSRTDAQKCPSQNRALLDRSTISRPIWERSTGSRMLLWQVARPIPLALSTRLRSVTCLLTFGLEQAVVVTFRVEGLPLHVTPVIETG